MLAAAFALGWFTCQAVAGSNDALLIITNKNYANGADEVKFADRDGAEFKRMAREVLGIPEANITWLSDMTAGKLQLLFGRGGAGSKQLKRLFKQPDTTLWVLYSGHGISAIAPGDTRPQPFLLPIDIPAEDAGSQGLPIADMEDALVKAQREQSAEGRIVLFLEACFSGKSGDGSDLVKGASATFRVDLDALGQAAKDRREQIAKDGRFLELAAADFSEIAYWDKDRRLGVFSDAVIEGLYGPADATKYGGNHDKIITFGELSAFVKQRVKLRLDYLYPERNRLQTPVPTGDLDAVLVRFGTRYMVHDLAANAREQAMCDSLGSNRDELVKYLAQCSSGLNYCLCEDQARIKVQKLDKLDYEAEACRAENFRLDELLQREPKDREALASLAEHSSCPDVIKRLQTIQKSDKPADTEIPRLLQIELHRVGCNTGAVDGDWNAAAQKSLGLFNKNAKTTFDVTVASLDALKAVSNKPARICPLICDHGYKPDGDACIKITCKVGFEVGDDNACESIHLKRREKPVVSVRPSGEPKATAPRSNRSNSAIDYGPKEYEPPGSGKVSNGRCNCKAICDKFASLGQLSGPKIGQCKSDCEQKYAGCNKGALR
ncbi:caspase family protein [Bradyrhizobium genosp. A]|uniref:caspase family protein n=1 Tax=Bradyrhizobium genosp. A TaxID=83626 RepID=UPI003CEA81FA